jgi:hypothetical protein
MVKNSLVDTSQERLNVRDAAAHTGIHYQTLRHRHKKGQQLF